MQCVGVCVCVYVCLYAVCGCVCVCVTVCVRVCVCVRPLVPTEVSLLSNYLPAQRNVGQQHRRRNRRYLHWLMKNLSHKYISLHLNISGALTVSIRMYPLVRNILGQSIVLADIFRERVCVCVCVCVEYCLVGCGGVWRRVEVV